MKKRRWEMWLLDAQGVLKNVGDCEDHGEANSNAGEQVLQRWILALHVCVIDVDDPFCEIWEGCHQDAKEYRAEIWNWKQVEWSLSCGQDKESHNLHSILNIIFIQASPLTVSVWTAKKCHCKRGSSYCVTVTGVTVIGEACITAGSLS